MRIRTILAAAAAPAALAAVLLGTAGSASAAVSNPNANPGNGAVVIKTQEQADALSGTTIDKNVVIAAGATTYHQDGTVWLTYAHITGNLSVQGEMTMAGDTVDGSVTVSGPGSYLDFSNQASHLKRDLNVQGSSGVYIGGPSNGSLTDHVQYPGAGQPTAVVQVDGNLNFTGNTSSLWIGYPMHVNGKFVYSNNTVTAWWGDTLSFSPSWVAGLTADGGQFIS